MKKKPVPLAKAGAAARAAAAAKMPPVAQAAPVKKAPPAAKVPPPKKAPATTPPEPLAPAPITGIEGYAPLVLHGPNWLDDGARPLAVLWGFAARQQGFVAQFLPEHRAAFVDPATPWTELTAHLDRLEGIRFIVWRCSEDEAVRAYAARRGIPTARMDDGFIRSVAPGRHPARPYAMVLDASGSSGDATRHAGLERLLGAHDFATSKPLLGAVPALLQLHRQLGITKDNQGSFASAARLLGPKLLRRILVVGESPRIAACENAKPQGWTVQRLLALAAHEHPRSEIIFRPHPDDANAWAKDPGAAAQLGTPCRVVADDVALPDLLRSVDHVYVHTSLVGLEALLHGLAVTVVGAPFYAGWGLTDDRQDIPGRTRRLSLEELYCAAYLLHPRYLADLDDPVTGLLATMLHVAAQRRQALDAAVTPALVRSHAASLAHTDYWPVLLRPDNLQQLATLHSQRLLKVFSIPRAFADSKAERFQRSVASLIVGQFLPLPAAADVLRQVRAAARTDVYRDVLLDLWRMAPSAEVLGELAWCSEKAGEPEETRRLLEHLAFGAAPTKDPKCRLPFAPVDHPRAIRLAQFESNQKEFARSEQLFNWLLLSGCLQPEVFAGLAAIARLRFDFASNTLLLAIARRLHPTWKQGRLLVQHAQACGLTEDPVSALESMAVACLANPQHVESTRSIGPLLDQAMAPLSCDEALLLAMELGESDNIVGRARGLIAHERHADAERLLLGHPPRPEHLVKHALTLSLAYSYQGKLDEAMTLVSRLLATSPTLPVYHEGLRLAIMANAYPWGQALLTAARQLHLEVSDIFERKIALGMGQLKDSYLTFRRTRSTATLRGHLGAKYVQSLGALARAPGRTNLVATLFGPGDEIRFATTYAKIRAAGGDSRMLFACDPRLHGLLSRHYTQLEFVPSARIRSLARLKNFHQHDQLPGSDLHAFFDNRGWAEARAADKVILVSDALGDIIEGYDSFSGVPCLKADPERVSQWRRRLPQNRHAELLVGLSWRSSLLSSARNEHYFSVAQLLPLFALEGVRFVNLQYDDCRDEIAWLEERVPGRMLHFDDLDQFNDLEGVAALMECLDLVVAPATTVVELAGALGRPTFLLSNSSELHWRKIPGSRMDAWHNAILHVEAPRLGDKEGLIRELASDIRWKAAARPATLQAVA